MDNSAVVYSSNQLELANDAMLVYWLVVMQVGREVYNLGTGKGTSVLEMVAAFEKVSGKVAYLNHSACIYVRQHMDVLFIQLIVWLADSVQKIPLVLTGQRPGDAEIVYAATAKAEKELKWK